MEEFQWQSFDAWIDQTAPDMLPNPFTLASGIFACSTFFHPVEIDNSPWIVFLLID
jgi:hypothetical protein